MSPTSVHVSVVSGANRERILAFVRSIKPDTTPSTIEATIIAIVNEQDTALAESLRSEGVHVRVNSEPKGFAKNHNDVMRTSNADYFLIANDDVLASWKTIESLVRFLEEPRNAKVAVVSPKLLNSDGSLQPSTYSFPTVARSILSLTGIRRYIPNSPFMWRLAACFGRGRGRTRFWEHDDTVQVDTLRGAFVMVRAAAVQAVGLMEEVALVGHEETEWHRRMRDYGWRVAYLHDLTVIHFGSETVRTDPKLDLEYLKGLLNYFAKHSEEASFLVVKLCAILVFASRSAAAAIVGDRKRLEIARAGIRVAYQWSHARESEDG